MRGPIAYGLSWPERIRSGAAAINFGQLAGLTFESIDSAEHRLRFPGLRLAWEALAAPAGSTAVLNAANEVAVAAFLEGKLRFDRIYQVNQQTMERTNFSAPTTLEALLDLDQQARIVARDAVARAGH